MSKSLTKITHEAIGRGDIRKAPSELLDRMYDDAQHELELAPWCIKFQRRWMRADVKSAEEAFLESYDELSSNHGVESFEHEGTGKTVRYSNTGDSYAPTVVLVGKTDGYGHYSFPNAYYAGYADVVEALDREAKHLYDDGLAKTGEASVSRLVGRSPHLGSTMSDVLRMHLVCIAHYVASVDIDPEGLFQKAYEEYEEKTYDIEAETDEI